MAAKRVRQLRKGTEPTIVSKNKDIVVALREIAAGNVIESEMTEQDALLESGAEALLAEEVQEKTEGEEEGASESS
jgi:DNA-directed RNA polymerase subunit omega